MHNSETLPKGIESWVELYHKCESISKEHSYFTFEENETDRDKTGITSSFTKEYVKDKAFEEMMEFHSKLTSREFKSLFNYIETLFQQVPYFKEHYLYKKFQELKPKTDGNK